MQPVVWNPLRDMDDLFHSLRRGLGRGVPVDAGGVLAGWVPAVDISENASEYRITGELPGVRREDVDISIDNGVLTLSGERRFKKDDEDKKHHRVERSYGGFSRSFGLPDHVAIEQITADYQDGVITVHLPKLSKARNEAKKIPVT